MIILSNTIFRICRTFALVFLILGTAFFLTFTVKMPGKSYSGTLSAPGKDTKELMTRMKSHVVFLGSEIGERNIWEYKALQKAEKYIENNFKKWEYPIQVQNFNVQGKSVKNIIAKKWGTTKKDEIILIGAHYDSVYGSPGANDNASGVAALLELARVFISAKTERSIFFAAFVNEEPPFFQTEKMGSLVYARYCREKKLKIKAMLSFDVIGYYSNKKGSQSYPFPLNFFYPDTGNFIAFVANGASQKLQRFCISFFRENTKFPTEGVAGPPVLPGIGWSDHWSFWQENYAALLLTDTGPFRYPQYHLRSDTPEHLDYKSMAIVVSGIRRLIDELLRSDKFN
ncbi:M28 family peptidase [Candidatus Riflebacteria bacterium]